MIKAPTLGCQALGFRGCVYSLELRATSRTLNPTWVSDFLKGSVRLGTWGSDAVLGFVFQIQGFSEERVGRGLRYLLLL